MKIRKVILLIELILISIYYLMIQFSITIQPINLILGFFIIFILPGYNFLNILKPDYSIIRKLGYSIILSLAIENIYMLFNYIILYNFMSYPEVPTWGFIFNSKVLITAIIFINLIFIIIIEYKHFKSKTEFDGIQARKSILNLSKIKEVLNLKVITVFIFFGLSLIFLGISTIYSNVPPDNNYYTSNVDYRLDFTFFYRVPLIFYIFLISSILSFIYIIFFIKNPYLILISISMFIYCIWILPYLQIGNFFGHDTYLLAQTYEVYRIQGLVTNYEFNFVVFGWDSLRYSTALFSTILLISATNVNLVFALWYLYPLFYIFIPFFFYSVFKTFSDKHNNQKSILIITVIFTTFTTFFIKSGHATGTGVIGVLVYFILVLEFFNLVQKNKFNISNFFLIIFLFFFLCLTHTEETIYFLVLLCLYFFYYPFYELKKINKNLKSTNNYSNNLLKEESINLMHIIQKDLLEKQLKKNFIKLCFLLIVLFQIFYFTNEFFGWIDIYYSKTLGSLSFFDKLFVIYNDSKITIPFLIRSSIEISILFIIAMFLGVFLFAYLIYFLFFKNFNLILRIYNTGIKFVKKVYNLISKLISKKFFPLIFFPSFIFLIIFLELYFVNPSLIGNQKINLIPMITLVLSYFIFVIQIYFLIKGIIYYQLKNNKQNFFLLAIIASSSVLFLFLIIGNFWLVIYLLQSKFSVFLFFFNLIIIQNTFIKDFKKKNYNYLVCIIVLTILLSGFYGLRKLAYG